MPHAYLTSDDAIDACVVCRQPEDHVDHIDEPISAAVFYPNFRQPGGPVPMSFPVYTYDGENDDVMVAAMGLEPGDAVVVTGPRKFIFIPADELIAFRDHPSVRR